jgi:hypothetical protein
MPERTSGNHRYVHGLFCEDVREEIGGGASYIGVFQPALQVTFPSSFPKVAAVIWVVYPVDDPMPTLELMLEVPGMEATPINLSSPSDGIPPIKVPGARRTLATAIIRIGNLMISEAGPMRVRVKCWDEFWTAASLMILPTPLPG